MRPFLTLHDPKQAGLYYEDGRWTQDTFYSLLDGLAQTQPGALALRDGRVSLSWSQLKGKVDSLAALYRSHGLVPGDRVSIWMSNKAESVIAFLACSREGLARNPSLHRTYTCQEIVELLERLSTRILITEQGWGGRFLGLRPGAAFPSCTSLSRTAIRPTSHRNRRRRGPPPPTTTRIR